MRKPPTAALPDIDDEVFKQRLAPLARAVLPGGSEQRLLDVASGNPESRKSEGPGIRYADIPEERRVEFVTSQQAAPAVVGVSRPARGPRRGVEFLLPEQVVIALKIEAAQRGTSMSVRVLEILRDAGYPVSDQDFIDMRKLPRK